MLGWRTGRVMRLISLSEVAFDGVAGEGIDG